MPAPPLKRILYVEDEPDIQEIALLALEAVGGFTVRTCGGGEEALREAPAFAPDLILLDVMMPDMDGPATLAALRAVPDLAGTPVVFLTAKALSKEVADLKALGAVDVIAKPFDPMALSQAISDIWTRHHAGRHDHPVS